MTDKIGLPTEKSAHDLAAPVNGSGPERATIPNFGALLKSRRAFRAGLCRKLKRLNMRR